MPLWNRPLVCVLLLGVLSGPAPVTLAQDQPGKQLDRPKLQGEQLSLPRLQEVTDAPFRAKPIDLGSALRLAGMANPEILRAREWINAAVAARQLAAAQILPSLNIGTNFNHHNGTLQRSTGQIIEVNRDSLYAGLGTNAIGGGTVTIPGLLWTGNISQNLYATLVSRQVVRQREFASMAVENDVLLRVASTYLDLLRATGRRAVAIRVQQDAAEVARVTANFAKTGQGRQADADRAATELELRKTEVVQAENDYLIASARLAQLLSLDPSEPLFPVDGWNVPHAIVPDSISLPELIAIALTQRPELKERRAAIEAALLNLKNAKLLPFSPNYLIGYSVGAFGGGSNLVANGIVQADGSILKESRFGNFADRRDFDAVLFWTARNLGVGNVAQIRLAQANLRQDQLIEIETLDRIRAQVATAHARTNARFAQIDINERAVMASHDAFKQDLLRTRNREGLPIEVLDSLRLLGRSQFGYLDAIIDYNRAQFELFVALGQPPAAKLSRSMPATLVPSPGAPEAK